MNVGATSLTPASRLRTTPTNVLLTIAFAVTAGFVLFYNLADFRTLGSHEAYAAVPARGMLESGDWIVPRFGGLPRLQKPPLAYWTVASSALVWGELDAWSARFPSAVSGLLLAVLIGLWAKRWYGTTAGWAAAFFQLTSAYLIIYARKAEVDVTLWLVMVGSLFLIVHQPVDESRRSSFVRWIAIYALLGISWLAKFHYGPAIVIAIAVTYYVAQGRYRQFWNFLNPVGLLLFGAAIFVWPWFLFQRIPAEEVWAVWQNETVGRAIGGKGLSPYWFYIPHLLWLTLPWTHLAAMGIKSSWTTAWKKPENEPSPVRRWLRIQDWKLNGDHREQFLWIWFFVVFGIVTISADKHKHYVAVGLPVFALMASQAFSRYWDQLKGAEAIFSRRSSLALGVAVLAGSGVCWQIVAGRWPQLASVTLVLSGLLGGGGVISAFLLATRYRQTALGVSIMTALACYVCVNGWLLPARDDRMAAARFAQKISRDTPATETINVFGLGMHPIFYYLDSSAVRLDTRQDVQKALAEQPTLTIVGNRDEVESLNQFGVVQIVEQCSDHAPAQMPIEANHVVAVLRSRVPSARAERTSASRLR